MTPSLQQAMLTCCKNAVSLDVQCPCWTQTGASLVQWLQTSCSTVGSVQSWASADAVQTPLHTIELSWVWTALPTCYSTKHCTHITTWSQWSSGNMSDLGVWEDQGSNPTMGSCMFIINTTAIHSLGHGLCTLTAVPRSTQPSTLCGMVKCVSAFGLSNNNKWRWWVWLLAAYRQPSGGLIAWGRQPLGAVPHLSY